MDDVLLNKAANIERCIQRIKEEYNVADFQSNFTKQDAAILNLLRACEACIDMGNRVIRLKSLGLPQSSRDVFSILEQAKIISPELSRQMQNMAGFRNIAVHNYTQLNMDIVDSIINNNLVYFSQFSQVILLQFS